MWSWNPAHREEIKDQQIIKFTHYSESGSKVLVAGAGTGRDLEILVDEGFECTALDVSEQMLNEAKSRGIRSKYIVHDFRTKLPFPSTSFDAVYCESALEHVPKKKPSSFYRNFTEYSCLGEFFILGLKKEKAKYIIGTMLAIK